MEAQEAQEIMEAPSPSLDDVIATAEPMPEPEAPEVTDVPDAKPITADAVSSDKEDVPTLPDSAILSAKIDGIFDHIEGAQDVPEQEPEPAPKQQQMADIESLRQLLGLTAPQQKEVQKAESDEGISALREEIAALRKEHADIRAEAERKAAQSRLEEAQREVSRFVTDNEDHFPLVNAIGQPELVFQRMYAERQQNGRTLGESVAARETEAELERAGHILAVKLGYVKPGEVESSGEEQVSVTAAMAVDAPLDAEDMSDEDYLEYVIRTGKQNQR